ncbi:cyclin-G-associated kinase-like [Manis pentadactyla]|uniref:cyclin-G-associated kinase-like n=1 Tax=Manis pentadactyla TaxID=143292 RepID=UPI00255CC301|nr:cyclin-G-associated kinase-like [Manis pentadactyla]
MGSFHLSAALSPPPSPVPLYFPPFSLLIPLCWEKHTHTQLLLAQACAGSRNRILLAFREETGVLHPPQAQHPVAYLPLASAQEPTPLPSAAKVHTQSTLSVLPLPARIPLLAKAPAKPHSGCGPAPDCKPSLHGTHTKPSDLTLPPSAPSPQPPPPFTCSRERLHLQAEARLWAPAEGARELRSQASHRGSTDPSQRPRSQ